MGWCDFLKKAWGSTIADIQHYESQEPLFHNTEPEAQEVSAQGIFDLYSLLDKETLDRVKEVINSIDPEKIKAVMEMIEPKKGEIKVTIDLRIRK